MKVAQLQKSDFKILILGSHWSRQISPLSSKIFHGSLNYWAIFNALTSLFVEENQP